MDAWKSEEWSKKRNTKRNYLENHLRPSERCRFPKAELLLLAEIKLRRLRGRRVSPRFVSRYMMQCVRSEYLQNEEVVVAIAPAHEDPPVVVVVDDDHPAVTVVLDVEKKFNIVDKARCFNANRRWRQRFYARYNLVTRRRTNKKSKALCERIKLWQAHHIALRRYLQTGVAQSAKFGLFDRCNRYNVDQVIIHNNEHHCM